MTAGTPGAPSDGDSLTAVLEQLADHGFADEVRAVPGGALRWRSCGHTVAASEVTVDEERRLEGASDPADMMLVAAAHCPVCGVGGAAVLHYGATAGEEDADVVAALAVR
jgi:hypothetical protein